MDDLDRTFVQPLEIVNRSNVRLVLDDPRPPEERTPMTIRIMFISKNNQQQDQKSPLVRVISEDELALMMEKSNGRDKWENESMTFGESVTLLIAVGVLLYLVYALLWPERF